jgi:hypothetical protein
MLSPVLQSQALIFFSGDENIVKTFLCPFVTAALKCSVDELQNFIYFSSTEESTSREVRVICSPYQDQDRSGIKKKCVGGTLGWE